MVGIPRDAEHAMVAAAHGKNDMPAAASLSTSPPGGIESRHRNKQEIRATSCRQPESALAFALFRLGKSHAYRASPKVRCYQAIYLKPRPAKYLAGCSCFTFANRDR